MFIIDLRNKLVSECSFSVMNNNNVDEVKIISNFVDYVDYSVYLKVASDDETYMDKIAIDSEDVYIEDDYLVVKWTMQQVSTAYKKIDIQLQFENESNELIAQSRIVSIKLGNTINADEFMENTYPSVLTSLQSQINAIMAGAGCSCSLAYANDVLTLTLYNSEGTAVDTKSITIPTLLSIVDIDFINQTLIFTRRDRTEQEIYLNHVFVPFQNATKDVNLGNHYYLTNKGVMAQEPNGDRLFGLYFEAQDSISLVSSDRFIQFVGNADLDEYDFDLVWSKNESGHNLELVVPIDEADGNQKTIATREYVASIVDTLKRNAFIKVDTTQYPTLESFLASTGEEGYIYLYPMTQDETDGFYQYIFESAVWVEIGTTNLILEGYARCDRDNDFTGNNTFSGSTTIYDELTIADDDTYSLKIYTHSEYASFGWDISGTYTECFRVENTGDLRVANNIVPTTNGNSDLGSSSRHWNNIYANGTYTNVIHSVGTGLSFEIGSSSFTYTMGRTDFYPYASGSVNLGTEYRAWKNLYVYGSLYGGTYNYTIDNSYKLLFNSYVSDNTITELPYLTTSVISVSSATTFTMATAPSNCYPEYKAMITNSSANTIALTFTGVSNILCNDENVVIASNVMSVPAGTELEISIVNGKLIAVNFSA